MRASTADALSPTALAVLRRALLEGLPWSPFDYVFGISASGDRSLHVDHLLRELPAERDLRFVHRHATAGERVVLAEVLPWDSEFFGFGVARLNAILPAAPPFDQPGADHAPAVAELLALARARGVKYLFAALDPRDVSLARALGACGFRLVETRVHQHRSLRDYSHPERHRIRQATPEDLALLERTAREMVNPYDRFHADPVLAQHADRLMSRWVRESVVGGFADATFVPDHPAPTAFCTTKYHEDRWATWGVRLAQPVVLGAVGPAFKGWYRKLISEICYRAVERGAEHAYFVTQIANPAAIRSVEALGFRIGRGEHVFAVAL